MTKELTAVTPELIAQVDEQIRVLRKQYDYDTKEYPIEVLLHKYHHGDRERATIFIPDYQRNFKWEKWRQVKFIESILLGVPIPPMLGAVQEEEGIEIIDGSQRLRTLEEFVYGGLSLDESLEKLTLLKGLTFEDFSSAQQQRFLLRTVRMQVIWNEMSKSLRADIFKRINISPKELEASEIRKGALDGPFYDFVIQCAEDQRFIELSRVAREEKNNDERQELITRFFAYAETYLEHKHDVQNFLDEYVRQKNIHFNDEEKEKKQREFERMLDFIERYFPFGFRKQANANSTPRVRFEAIAVGAHLALQQNPNLVPESLRWLESEEFREYTTSHGSNNKGRIKQRVEFVRNCLLNQEKDLHYASDKD
jgi:hypothetical protein